MSQVPGRLITYCTNIHPADSWDETFAALRAHVPAVKAALSPDAPFPIGLRLSGRAAAGLGIEENRTFKLWLESHDCFVPTINGFPYGSFHAVPVKEQVYLPDWRSAEREEYTVRLAQLLAGWLPDGVTGSISTVPLGFRNTLARDAGALPLIRSRLQSVLAQLSRIHEERGKFIMLALEPEPCCLLETTEEICRFFQALELRDELRGHLGICYDCCHQAVQFEDPARSLELLAAAGVPVAKIQASAALQASGVNREELRRFVEPTYLHQVVVQGGDGSLTRYADLHEALDSHPGDQGEWRCHFHVPIFSPGWGEMKTTRQFIEDFLPLAPGDLLVEVETYSWDALPAGLREGSVTDSIIREMRWLKERLHA